MCNSIPRIFWFIDLKIDQFVNLFIALITTGKKMDMQWLWFDWARSIDFKFIYLLLRKSFSSQNHFCYCFDVCMVVILFIAKYLCRFPRSGFIFAWYIFIALVFDFAASFTLVVAIL